jgi:hypothetical protein
MSESAELPDHSPYAVDLNRGGRGDAGHPAHPDVALLSPEFYVHPHPLFSWMRDHAPVYWDDGVGIWGITRYADVMTVAKDWRTFCSGKGSRLGATKSANKSARHVISGGLEALLANPDQLEALHRDPSLVHGAIEEMLRWVTPIQNMNRTAAREGELGGQQIREGDRMLLLLYLTAVTTAWAHNSRASSCTCSSRRCSNAGTRSRSCPRIAGCPGDAGTSHSAWSRCRSDSESARVPRTPDPLMDEANP